MTIASRTIYLASRSPRRRELLRQIGVGHELLLLRDDPKRGRDVDETPHQGESARDYVLRVACAKAAVGLEVLSRRRYVLHPVLGADTTIACDEHIIGKPVDAEDAVRILHYLGGRSHQVMTALAVAFGGRVTSALSVSTVTMADLDEERIRRYVASGEPMDKAGAYAVQGRAAAFITHIEGSYSGIMGLPLAQTAQLLAEFGVATP
jgi:septum formation protein